jgi:large subunit ribosomal protein L17
MLGRIKTTEAKAKELRPYVEKFLTLAKNRNVTGIRRLRQVFSEKIVKKIFERAEELKDRRGGYTRIIKMESRKGDGARIAILELVK